MNTPIFTLLICLCITSSSAVSTQNRLTSLIRRNSGATLPEISQCVAELELQSPLQQSFPELWSKLDGNWRLLYTNNGPIGSGDRPLPLPRKILSVSQVFQKIDSSKMKIEHILDIQGLLGGEIKLIHSVNVVSDSNPAMLSIALDEISAKGPIGTVNLPLSKIIGPDILRAGYFETTYVDDELRVSRGLMGELRSRASIIWNLRCGGNDRSRSFDYSICQLVDEAEVFRLMGLLVVMWIESNQYQLCLTPGCEPYDPLFTVVILNNSSRGDLKQHKID
eukprot:gene1755-3390_t